MTESSNLSSNFSWWNADQYKEACKARREAKAVLKKITEEEPKIASSDYESIQTLINDAHTLFKNDVVDLNTYRDLKLLIDDAVGIHEVVQQLKQQVEKDKLAQITVIQNVENMISVIKAKFRKQKGKVLTFERKRS